MRGRCRREVDNGSRYSLQLPPKCITLTCDGRELDDIKPLTEAPNNLKEGSVVNAAYAWKFTLFIVAACFLLIHTRTMFLSIWADKKETVWPPKQDVFSVTLGYIARYNVGTVYSSSASSIDSWLQGHCGDFSQ